VGHIAIVTDTTASIPKPLLEKYQIRTVPYFIHRGKETLRDLVTISRAAFYSWLPTATELPKTASPGPGDYYELYNQLATQEDVDEIISIHMTSKGSGAYQAALCGKEMAQEQHPNLAIQVVDTLNVSMCQGWIALESARSVLEGLPYTAILDRIQRLIPKVRMIQTADTLHYLYLGGRIGRAKHLVGSLLNIKPLISMEDGLIVALGTARSRMKAYQRMAELVESAVGEIGGIKIAYVHAAAADEVLKIKQLVEARVNVVESLIAELSPALGVHSGPGTVGFCFYPLD
jgi:DegV family protein with EDD domain